MKLHEIRRRLLGLRDTLLSGMAPDETVGEESPSTGGALLADTAREERDSILTSAHIHPASASDDSGAEALPPLPFPMLVRCTDCELDGTCLTCGGRRYVCEACWQTPCLCEEDYYDHS